MARKQPTATDEINRILPGLAAIAAAAGLGSEKAAQRLIERGLPVTQLGYNKAVTTTRLLLTFIEQEAEKRVSV